jgi:hypothetical protein
VHAINNVVISYQDYVLQRLVDDNNDGGNYNNNSVQIYNTFMSILPTFLFAEASNRKNLAEEFHAYNITELRRTSRLLTHYICHN